jgi:hypothetical protein
LVITYVLARVIIEGQYAKHLNWFAIDLKGERSAMDGQILEEHAKDLVQVVQWVLFAHVYVPIFFPVISCC